MNKKADAMEFLITYGWAILAAVIACGVLYYHGFLNPTPQYKITQTTCETGLTNHADYSDCIYRCRIYSSRENINNCTYDCLIENKTYCYTQEVNEFPIDPYACSDHGTNCQPSMAYKKYLTEEWLNNNCEQLDKKVKCRFYEDKEVTVCATRQENGFVDCCCSWIDCRYDVHYDISKWKCGADYEVEKT